MLRKWGGFVHGEGGNVISKVFSKTPSGATYAQGRWWDGWPLDDEVVCQGRCVLFSKRIGRSCDRYSNLTSATTLPLYGKGHYWVPRPILAWSRITSDGGELVLSLGTGSCQVGRPWLFSQGTGHTVGTPCLWYVMKMGARLHNFMMWNVRHGGYYQSSGLHVSVV